MNVNVNADDVELLARGTHPNRELEHALTSMARHGQLKGVVTKPPRYSATTIQKYIDCPRLYYWPTVAGLDTPPSDAQLFGTALHAMAESWLKHGKEPPHMSAAGRLLARGLSLLPAPGTAGLHVEAPFRARIEGVPDVEVTGTIDCYVEPTCDDPERFLVLDHKTSRSKRWAKDAAWLRDNVQATLYAHVLAKQFTTAGYDVHAVEKRWIYYYRDEQCVEQLVVVQAAADIAEQVQETIKPALRDMSAMVAAAPRVGDVTANRKACSAYGGCPHLARCQRADQETTMGVLAGKFSKSVLTAKKVVDVNPPAPRAHEDEVPARKIVAQVAEHAARVFAKARPVEAPEEVAEEPAQVEAPRRRPKSSKNAAPTASPSDSSSRSPGTNVDHDFWLFIDCRPLAGIEPPVMLEQLLGPAQANAARATNSDHYRQGASYGVLEATFATWMEAHAITGGVHVSTATIAARDVLGLLRAHASVVIQGG